MALVTDPASVAHRGAPAQLWHACSVRTPRLVLGAACMALAAAAIGVPTSVALASGPPPNPKASLPADTNPGTTPDVSPVGPGPPPVKPLAAPPGRDQPGEAGRRPRPGEHHRLLEARRIGSGDRHRRQGEPERADHLEAKGKRLRQGRTHQRHTRGAPVRRAAARRHLIPVPLASVPGCTRR
jgi:hypothetical protein